MADPSPSSSYASASRQRQQDESVAMEKDDVVAMEELVDEEEEEEEEEEDVGPSYNPELFKFLLEDVSSSRGNLLEGKCDLNRPFRVKVGGLDNPHGAVVLEQGKTSSW
jgi:RNA recognition motif-containing protein